MRAFVISALLVVSSVGAAAAEDQRVTLRGTVTAFSDNVVTVATKNAGVQKATIPADARVTLVAKAQFSDIAAGTYVGAAAVPQSDGTLRALEVTVFPAGQTPGPGSRPYDLTPASSMTNGSVSTMAMSKVDAIDAHVLTVTYEGGEKQIVVTQATPIVTLLPGSRAALVPGAHIIVVATKNEAGDITAARVSVGKDGLTPPM